MKIFSFGTLTTRNVYPFIVSILYVTRSYVFLEIKHHDTKKTDWGTLPWFFTLLMFLGEAGNGFLDLFSEYLIKRRSLQIADKPLNIKTKITYIPAKAHHSNKWLLGLYLYLSSLMEGFSLTAMLVVAEIHDGTADFSFQMRIFNLFFIVVLSYCCLSYRIYRHQIVSCFIVGMGIILFLIAKLSSNSFTNTIFIHFGIYCGIYIVFSVREVFQKWLMEIQLIKPVRITFIEGVFGFINTSTGILLYDHFSPKHLSLLESVTRMFTQGKLMILLFFAFLFLSLCYGYFAIYTKFWFSPTMMPIAYSFTIILWEGVLRIEGNTYKTLDSLWYIMPGYFLLFFGCLLYNELIIFHFCGLSFYTKKEISERSKQECHSSVLLPNSNNTTLAYDSDVI